MKLRTKIVLSAAIFAFIALILFVVVDKGPDLSRYESLETPRLTVKGDEHVLEVTFNSMKAENLPKAFAVLFKAYFSLSDTPKGPEMGVPRGRYSLQGLPDDPVARAEVTKTKGFTGSVAIPVPASTTMLVQVPDADGLFARMSTWKYGEVAEILHRGSYETEPATIAKLEEFIRSIGYEIFGDHEEEYLKGPGMAFVLPSQYWTIIRYQVRRIPK